jgi:hypothetical protein
MATPVASPDRDRITTDVLTRVATGQLAGVVIESHGITRQTWSEWCRADRALSDAYARARDEQAHAMAEEALRIADGDDALTLFYEAAVDAYEEELERSAVNDKAKANARKICNALRSNIVQRDRMRMDARKWLTSKIAPKLYGEKLDVTSGGEKLQSAVIALPLEEMPPDPVESSDSAAA